MNFNTRKARKQERRGWIFGNFNASSENFRIFAVGIEKSFEFYRKIFHLGPPTLQVPRRPCEEAELNRKDNKTIAKTFEY